MKVIVFFITEQTDVESIYDQIESLQSTVNHTHSPEQEPIYYTLEPPNFNSDKQ